MIYFRTFEGTSSARTFEVRTNEGMSRLRRYEGTIFPIPELLLLINNEDRNGGVVETIEVIVGERETLSIVRGFDPVHRASLLVKEQMDVLLPHVLHFLFIVPKKITSDSECLLRARRRRIDKGDAENAC